jgi:hypothetical protein
MGQNIKNYALGSFQSQILDREVKILSRESDTRTSQAEATASNSDSEPDDHSISCSKTDNKITTRRNSTTDKNKRLKTLDTQLLTLLQGNE